MEYIFNIVPSSQIDGKMIDDFCSVCSEAFGSDMRIDDFRRKYLDNPYGDSILCVVYDEDGTPAAARALWRNDIGGRTAYQPCDTCVLKQYRRQGLFEKMTFAAIEKMEPGAVIYNYPNDNSRRLYLKLGWQVNGEYKPRFWRGYKAYHMEHSEIMTDTYFSWWLQGSRDSRYSWVKKADKYLLVKNRGKYFRMVTAEISKETADKLPKASGFRLLMYWSKEMKRYNQNHESFIVLSRGEGNVVAPIWKMDVI